MKMQKHVEPRWTLKTTYYWQQTFAPGRETVIQHQYKPSVGRQRRHHCRRSAACRRPDIAKQLAAYKTKYCMDAGFVAAATRCLWARRRKRSERSPRRRAAARLHPQDRRQLGRPDRRFHPHDRQGRPQQPGQLLRGRGQEAVADPVPSARTPTLPQPPIYRSSFSPATPRSNLLRLPRKSGDPGASDVCD